MLLALHSPCNAISTTTSLYLSTSRRATADSRETLRTAMMKNRIYISTLRLCIVLLFLASCDAMYIVQGRVSELDQVKSSDHSHDDYLKDVAIHVSYLKDKQGNIGRIVEHQYSTDENGSFRISFIGPPFRLGHDVFLEFTKVGYASKRVFVDENQADVSASVYRCKDTSYKRCWTIDVKLPRDGER